LAEAEEQAREEAEAQSQENRKGKFISFALAVLG
jgi:hypothetical protein